jgi:hypothetical protein
LHGGEPFAAICRQCGTYMCKRCNEDGKFDKCARCREEQAAVQPETPWRAAGPTAANAAFPFRRDGVAWGTFLRFCFERYTHNFGVLTLAMIVCLGAMFVLNMLGGGLMLLVSDFELGSGLTMIVLPIVHALVLSVLTLGVLQISLRVAQNQPAELSLLWAGVPRLGAFLLVAAAMGAALLGVELVLFVAFGLGFASLDSSDWTLGTIAGVAAVGFIGFCASIYVALGLVFACLEIVAQPELSVRQALKNAWRIAHGERLTLGFGMFLINLALFAGLLMCGVGIVFTLGFAAVLFAALYLALRNGAPVEPAALRPPGPNLQR